MLSGSNSVVYGSVLFLSSCLPTIWLLYIHFFIYLISCTFPCVKTKPVLINPDFHFMFLIRYRNGLWFYRWVMLQTTNLKMLQRHISLLIVSNSACIVNEIHELEKRRIKSCLSHLSEHKPWCENLNSRAVGSLLLRNT